MPPSLSTDPTDRMGIYKHIDDIPPEHRFEQFADQYDGRDVWSTFLEDLLFDVYEAERSREKALRAGCRRKQHMRDHGRRHALARPMDVETSCRSLRERASLNTVYYSYWVCFERFYRWLAFHTAHPHRYNPVLMAATHHRTAGAVWETKIAKGGSA